MKRKSIILFFSVVLLFCCSCVSNVQLEEDSTVYNSEFDAQQEYASSDGRLCKVGSVYYYMPIITNRVLYYDDETGASGLLCGKADCTHEDASCNSYVNAYGSCIQAYQEKIYWIEQDTLYRMDLDGSNHEGVGTLERPDKSAVMEGVNPRFVIHRDMLYISTMKPTIIEGEAKTEVSIYQYKMSNLEDAAEEVFRGYYPGEQDCHYRCRFEGNALYLMIDYGSLENDGQTNGELYRYNISEAVMEKLWTENIEGNVYNMIAEEEGIHIATINSRTDGDRRTGYYTRFYTYWLEKQQMEISDVVEIPAEEDFWGIGLEEGYFMMLPGLYANTAKYRIYDWEGNLIREGEAPGKELICNGCDSTGWLFQQENYSSEKREYVLIRIPVSPAEKEDVLMRYTVYNNENG